MSGFEPELNFFFIIEGANCFNKYSQSHMNNTNNNRDFHLVNIILSEIIPFLGTEYFDNAIR